MERDVFQMKKQSTVIGTFEPAAFILSLRDSNEFCKTHSSGYHCIPHIGVYGENYTVCSPIALLSLPPTTSCLQRLPLDLQGALDLPPLCEQWLGQGETTHTDLDRRVNTQAAQNGTANYSVEETEEEEEEERLLNEPSSRRLNQVRAAGTFDTVKEEEEEEEKEENIHYGSNWGTISIVVQKADTDYSQTLKRLAKKIVMNALHKACKVLEASVRRSSIDYLVANTKRLKVGRSPSPLKESREEETASPQPMENNDRLLPVQETEGLRLDATCISDGSSTWDMCPPVKDASSSVDRNRKRSRSHSQESHAMNELHLFRLQKGITPNGIKICEQREEDLTIGACVEVPNSVTLPENRVNGHQCGLDMSCLCLDNGNNGFCEGTHFSLGINGHRQELEPSQPHFGLGTVINSLQKMSITDPFTNTVGNKVKLAQPNGVNGRDSSNTCSEWSVTTLPGIDLFVVIHTYPPPSACQKFLCYKDNEVNLMYHFWLFPDAPFDESYVGQEALQMGVFEPRGVAPVHLNLQDGGVAFHYMEHRTVCIHKCSFSPENAQLELQRGNHLHTFFSAAKSSGNRMVITYHIVPGNYYIEQQLRNVVGHCSTLSELVEGVSKDFPEPGATIHTLINSLRR